MSKKEYRKYKSCYIRVYNKNGVVFTATPDANAEEMSVEIMKLIQRMECETNGGGA